MKVINPLKGKQQKHHKMWWRKAIKNINQDPFFSFDDYICYYSVIN